MTVEQRKESWKREEEIARIHGWDFSHIHGRYTEEDDLPWDFGKIIQKYREDSMKLMDMETGGGEFLLTFRHPYENTAAIEGYPPNVELCKKVLLREEKISFRFPIKALILSPTGMETMTLRNCSAY